MSTDHLSARDYERVADASRRRLASSLDELSSSLTPGRVLDEVMTYARGGGTDFLRGLGKAASGNPIPTLLISAGTLMFLSGKGHLGDLGIGQSRTGSATSARPTSSVGRPNVHSSEGWMDNIQDGANSVGSAIGDAGSRASDAIGAAGSAAADQLRRGKDALSSAAGAAAGVAHDAADKARNLAGSAAEAATGAADEAGRYASEMAGSLSDRAGHMRDDTADLIKDMADRATKLAREQPLVVAAAGLAIGAILASLLPRTETEDAYMGETSDAVKETVGEVAGEQFEKAKAAASNLVDEARAVAEREGLTPDAAVQAVKDLGERVKTVASEVGNKVA